MIRAKVTEYMERAEKLKTHLAEQNDKKKPAAMGANGAASNGGGSGKYADTTMSLQAVSCPLTAH